jgi:hypothetical protein
MMDAPDNLDFLSDPVTPTVVEPNVPATTNVVILTAPPAPKLVQPEPELTPAQRIAEATAARDAAQATLTEATRYLNKLIADSAVVEVEIPLHVRNAEAREIDRATSRNHREAMARLTEQGIDVARVVREAPRPRARKPVPPLFTP